MKKSMFTIKSMVSLLSFIMLASCSKDTLETETLETSEKEPSTVAAARTYSFGATRDLVRGNPLPFEWAYLYSWDAFNNSRKIIYTGGASFGWELSIAATTNRPFGWYTKVPNVSGGQIRIVFLGGDDIPFNTKIAVSGGQNLPSNWVYDQTGSTQFSARAVYLGNSFLGDKSYALVNQNLPSGWEYQEYNPNGPARIENVNGTPRPAPTPPSLLSGEILWGGQHRDSPNGQYRLSMQSDGNLVLYDLWNLTSEGWWTALWYSNTYNNPGARLAMQADGNLVVYSSANSPLWNSETWGNPGAQLHVQDDGNLVIYSNGIAKWHRWQ